MNGERGVQRWSLEVKVGAFVVLGLTLLVIFIFAIGDLSTGCG